MYVCEAFFLKLIFKILRELFGLKRKNLTFLVRIITSDWHGVDTMSVVTSGGVKYMNIITTHVTCDTHMTAGAAVLAKHFIY